MIRAEIRGLEQVKRFLESVPHGTIGLAAQEVADYLMGDSRHGLKHYPPYKHVTRKAAYGRTFFSDRQRRWFFWALGSGRLKLPYARTGALGEGWEKIGDKWRPVLRNKTPYAHHVMGDDRQSRMSAKIGWRTISENIADNIKGALQRAEQAIQRWLKEKGK